LPPQRNVQVLHPYIYGGLPCVGLLLLDLFGKETFLVKAEKAGGSGIDPFR
jgi:hypothetical protein